MKRTTRRGRMGLALCLGLTLGVLGGCDDLLDVELPHQLTGEALEDPGSAGGQVASAIALFECGYSAFGWIALGHEDVFESVAGVAGGAHVFRETSVTGGCDASSQDQSWFDQMMGARAILTNAQGRGVYDRLQNEWDVTQVPDRASLMAIGALYTAASLDHFGEFYCEFTMDGGPLMSPSQTLDLAEQWIGRAITHIGEAGGDFEMPYGISASAEDMAYALRARIRWANGDLTGAAADAARVDQDFVAWVTRETGPQRRNKIYDAGTAVGFSGMIGPNDWWSSPIPNPASGEVWPSPIPFTGYLNLGILDDGRAVDADGYAVLETDAGAVDDTRVQHFVKAIQGPEPRDVPAKYSAEDDDIPLVTGREMWLIRAQFENEVNDDRAEAIALVNDLRGAAGLPLVTYLDATASEEDVRYLIIEERRREFFAEGGRYWATKILNPDILWFPRGDGATPAQGYQYGGGVRMLLPGDEYTLNENLTLGDRATMCDPNQAPTIIG